MIRRPPRSTLFPYPPRFRSLRGGAHGGLVRLAAGAGVEREQRDEALLRRRGRHHARRLVRQPGGPLGRDRKSTRLNSSHANISYGVVCLKKKKRSTQS